MHQMRPFKLRYKDTISLCILQKFPGRRGSPPPAPPPAQATYVADFVAFIGYTPWLLPGFTSAGRYLITDANYVQ